MPSKTQATKTPTRFGLIEWLWLAGCGLILLIVILGGIKCRLRIEIDQRPAPTVDDLQDAATSLDRG